MLSWQLVGEERETAPVVVDLEPLARGAPRIHQVGDALAHRLGWRDGFDLR